MLRFEGFEESENQIQQDVIDRGSRRRRAKMAFNLLIIVYFTNARFESALSPSRPRLTPKCSSKR
jgi:hypothetical protein